MIKKILSLFMCIALAFAMLSITPKEAKAKSLFIGVSSYDELKNALSQEGDVLVRLTGSILSEDLNNNYSIEISSGNKVLDTNGYSIERIPNSTDSYLFNITGGSLKVINDNSENESTIYFYNKYADMPATIYCAQGASLYLGSESMSGSLTIKSKGNNSRTVVIPGTSYIYPKLTLKNDSVNGSSLVAGSASNVYVLGGTYYGGLEISGTGYVGDIRIYGTTSTTTSYALVSRKFDPNIVGYLDGTSTQTDITEMSSSSYNMAAGTSYVDVKAKAPFITTNLSSQTKVSTQSRVELSIEFFGDYDNINWEVSSDGGHFSAVSGYGHSKTAVISDCISCKGTEKGKYYRACITKNGFTSYSAVTALVVAHSLGDTYKYDETEHWLCCIDPACGLVSSSTKAEHVFNSADDVIIAEATINSNGRVKKTCSVCGFETEEPYAFDRYCGTAVGYDLIVGDRVTLKIYGSGAMDDYTENADKPWKSISSNNSLYPYGKIDEIVIENGVTSVGAYAFDGTSSQTAINYFLVKNVVLPNTIEEIRTGAFKGLQNLKGMTIPYSVSAIYYKAFANVKSGAVFVFTDDAPDIANDAFEGSTVTIKYPRGYASWDKEISKNYGGTITWVAYTKCDHSISKVASVPSTCTVNGVKEYYVCSKCETCFEDANGDVEIADIDAWKASYGSLTLATHNYSSVYKYDSENHWQECTKCKLKVSVSPHHHGEASCTEAGVCDTCGAAYIDPLGHIDENNDYKCDRCGEVLHTHTTKTRPIQAATTTKNGKYEKYCKDCGEILGTGTIYAATNVTLSATSYVYDGTAKAPEITVKDSHDNVISTSNYTVTTPAGRTEVGKYTYKIEFKNRYSGTVELSFNIVPKKATSVKTAAASTGVKVSWAAADGATTYYIYKKEVGGSFAKLGATTKLTYTDTAVESGKSYVYRIYAYAKVDNVVYKADKSSDSTICYLAAPTVSSIANSSTGVAIKWSAVTGADGYYVYRSDDNGSSFSNVKKTTSLSYTDTEANTNGKKYVYTVYAYKVVDGKTYKGYKSSDKSYYFVSRPTISSLTSTTATKAVVKWDANTKAKGYEITYSTSSSFSGAKTVAVTGSSTVSKTLTLTSGKKYYIKVRSYYETSSGTKYYSQWSASMYVTVK